MLPHSSPEDPVQFPIIGILVGPNGSSGYSADLQMRHQKLFTLARHLSVGHFE